MSDSFYWCIQHQRVESNLDKCSVDKLLGPYPTRGEAEHALDRVRERNEAWEAEDTRWRGEPAD